MIKVNTISLKKKSALDFSTSQSASFKKGSLQSFFTLSFKKGFFLYLPLLTLSILFIPAIRHYLDAEMSLKMLVQIPLLTVSGFIFGLGMSATRINIIQKISNQGATSLVFLFGTQTFWMIPRSLDMSVNNDISGILLYLSLMTAGFLFGAGFKTAPFVLKTAFSIYGLAMALAMAIVFIYYDALICSVYTIEMQRIAGKNTLYVFPFIFALFLYRLFYNMARLARNGNQDE